MLMKEILQRMRNSDVMLTTINRNQVETLGVQALADALIENPTVLHCLLISAKKNPLMGKHFVCYQFTICNR